jgi:hypothetical protein
MSIVALIMLVFTGIFLAVGLVQKDIWFWAIGCVFVIVFGMTLNEQGIEKNIGSTLTYDVNGNISAVTNVYQNVNSALDPMVYSISTFCMYGGLVSILISFGWLKGLWERQRKVGGK